MSNRQNKTQTIDGLQIEIVTSEEVGCRGLVILGRCAHTGWDAQWYALNTKTQKWILVTDRKTGVVFPDPECGSDIHGYDLACGLAVMS